MASGPTFNITGMTKDSPTVFVISFFGHVPSSYDFYFNKFLTGGDKALNIN